MIILQLAVGLLLLDTTDDQGPGIKGPLGSPAVSLLVGLALLAYAGWLLAHRPGESGEPGALDRLLRDPQTASGAFFVAGVVLALTDISSLILLSGIITKVGHADVGVVGALLVLAIDAAIVSLTATGPPGGRKVRRRVDSAGRRGDRGVLQRHGRYIVGAMLLVFGAQMFFGALGAL